MAPDAMPAPVAAQALQVIERRLPPRTALANRPAADEAWLKRAGAADLMPVAEQQRLAAPAGARPLPAGRGSGSLANELGLLVEGNRVNLFQRGQATRTAEQAAFLARAARERPDAAVTMHRFTDQARAMHTGNVTRGTEFVIRGIGRAAPSAQVMRRVTDAATRANPSAAALINRHASESYRGADRGELNRQGQPGQGRPGGERQGTERPGGQQRAVHPPNDYERRQSRGQRAQPGAPQRQQPGAQQQQRQQGGNFRPPQQQRPQAGPPQRQQRPQRDQRDRRRDEQQQQR